MFIPFGKIRSCQHAFYSLPTDTLCPAKWGKRFEGQPGQCRLLADELLRRLMLHVARDYSVRETEE